MKRNLKFALALMALLTACSTEDTTVIFQVSDPQMGFYTRNADMVYESEMFTKAAAAINATMPDAVIFTGDLVHDHKDSLQWLEFKRIAATIDPAIRQFSIPGNHDVNGKNGSMDLTYWNRYMGEDKFSAEVGNVHLIGIDSNLYKYVEGSEADIRQQEWLENELADCDKDGITIVLAHHPFFLKSADEDEEYFNIRTETRNYYRDLFRSAGVKAVVCGHKHDNYLAADGDIPYITTSATGKPLGDAPSGVRVFVCEKGEIYHAYFTPEQIPLSRAELISLVKESRQ